MVDTGSHLRFRNGCRARLRPWMGCRAHMRPTRVVELFCGSGGAVARLRMMIPSWPAGSALVAALAVVIALRRTRGSVSVPWVVAGGPRARRGSGGAIARLRSGGSVPRRDGYLGVTTVSLRVVL